MACSNLSKIMMVSNVQEVLFTGIPLHADHCKKGYRRINI